MKAKKYLILSILFLFILSISGFATAEKKPLIVQGLLQTQFTQSNTAVDQFRIARARFRFKGYLDDKINYNILADVVTSPALWAAHINMKLTDFLTLRGGQFKSPFSKTYLSASHTWDTTSLPNSINSIAHKYDIGVQVMGKYQFVKYKIGLFNGTGRNTADSDNNKDIIGRIDLVNLYPGFEIGGSGYYGKDDTTKNNKKGAGFNIRYKTGPLDIHSELMAMTDSPLKKQGGFLMVGYEFLPKNQVIVMYDIYDPDINTNDDKQNTLTLGWNWLVTKKTKLQVNYLIVNEEPTEIDNNQLIAQWQVVF